MPSSPVGGGRHAWSGVHRSSAGVVIATLCFGCLTHDARAQRDVPPPADAKAQPALADDARDANVADVYLNDSFDASDAIRRARRLADAGRWSEAAELLQRTSDSSGAKIVALDSGVFLGIRGHIANLIAGWPTPGLEAYRWLYERDLTDSLDTMGGSRRIGDYLTLFDRYFCTHTAADLADTIGQLAIEAGDLPLAERVYARVLQEHPDRNVYRKQYGAMLLVIRAMSGESIPSTVTDAGSMRWMGGERRVAEIIAELDGFQRAASPDGDAKYWPVFGGRADRNRLGATTVDELGLLWRYEDFALLGLSGEEGGLDHVRQSIRQASRRLTMQVVAADGLLYIQNWREIVALHRTSGVLAWRFGADEIPTTRFSDFDEQPTGWDCVTVHDGRVYAALPGDIVPYYGYETAQSPPELVCLDGQTGSIIWRVNREVVGTPLTEIGFDSSPLVGHGKMFVVGRRRRSFGFEDCYLYALNAADGSIEFRTHLGSASTGAFGARTPTNSMAALHGGTVYICTNLGSVAAVSAYTGAVRWLRLYDRNRAVVGDSDWAVRDVKPWSFNPVVYSEGRIIALPVDAADLLVYDAADGRLLHSVPIDDMNGMSTLLGVHGALVCGVGDSVVCYDLGKSKIVRSVPIPADDAVFGRGTWTQGRLLVPTRNGLLSVDLTAETSSLDTWEQAGRGGNVLALDEQLLIAGVGSVATYVRKADLWRGLRSRMAESPNDPLPALELAEIAMRGGDQIEAVTVLDVAIDRAGGFAEPLDPKFQRRLFNDVLMFVDELDAHQKLDAELLEKMYGYASQCAPDAESHLRYRLRLAPLFARFGKASRAVRLYQQILLDRSLRELPAPSPGEPPAVAGRIARDRIASLIEERGVAVYALIEAEAQQRLERARRLDDDARLAQIEEFYPNSKAAPRSVVARGELALRAGRPDAAATLLAAAYHRYPKQVNQPRLVKMIADAYEQVGKPAVAYRWLTKGGREHPGELIDHKGRSMTLLQYRERLASVADRVLPSRPSPVLPLTKIVTKAYDQGVTLLAPRFADASDTEWSRYFLYTPEGLRCIDAQGHAEAWPNPVTVRAVPELLLAGSKIAVFATMFELFAVDIETGVRRWSHARYPPDFVGQDDWEGGDGFRTHVRHGDRVVSVRESGEAVCIDMTNGEVAWSRVLQAAPIGRLRLSDEWLVYHAVPDGMAQLFLVDAATGAWRRTITLDEPRSVEDLFMTLDGRVVVVTSRSVTSYDTETGRRSWRTLLDGHLRTASLMADFDALYFSDDGRHLTKLGLEDGRELWRSERLARRGDENLTVERQGGSILLCASGSVGAVDEVTGLTLWKGTVPDGANFVDRFVTTSYLVAVHVPEPANDATATVYFYDHRNASGLIPRNGGALDLGKLKDVRVVVVTDSGLVVQDGMTILGWSRASGDGR